MVRRREVAGESRITGRVAMETLAEGPLARE